MEKKINDVKPVLEHQYSDKSIKKELLFLNITKPIIGKSQTRR
jgi:hypothetical protein